MGYMSTRKEKERLELLQGTLDLLILRTLIFGPQHGQGIARAMLKNAPHSNAARLFMNFYLEPEQQIVYANAGYNPVVGGVIEKTLEEMYRAAPSPGTASSPSTWWRSAWASARARSSAEKAAGEEKFSSSRMPSRLL